MLRITIEDVELFDDSTQEFVTHKGTTIDLEHSLFSLSKWESKYEKSFINTSDKSAEEIMDYIRMMTLNPDVPDHVYNLLTKHHGQQINDYIASPQTATTFSDRKRAGGREIITAEIIYHWMVVSQIPFETQYWHLNRLLTLVKVCSEKSKNPKKMSRANALQQQRQLNAARKAEMGTSG